MNPYALICAGIGLLTILFACVKRGKLQKCTHAITARVVSHTDCGDFERRAYRPVVEYTYEGKTLRSSINEVISSEFDDARRSYPAGKKVKVYINPKHPKICATDPEKEADNQLLFVIIGAVFAAVSLTRL